MAKKTRRVYIYKRRSGRRGGFRLPKLLDVSQGIDNADRLGYFDAAASAMNGDYTTAKNTLVARARSVPNALGTAMDNVIIGFNRAIIRKTGGKFVRKFIA